MVHWILPELKKWQDHCVWTSNFWLWVWDRDSPSHRLTFLVRFILHTLRSLFCAFFSPSLPFLSTYPILSAGKLTIDLVEELHQRMRVISPFHHFHWRCFKERSALANVLDNRFHLNSGFLSPGCLIKGFIPKITLFSSASNSPPLLDSNKCPNLPWLHLSIVRWQLSYSVCKSRVLSPHHLLQGIHQWVPSAIRWTLKCILNLTSFHDLQCHAPNSDTVISGVNECHSLLSGPPASVPAASSPFAMTSSGPF